MLISTLLSTVTIILSLDVEKILSIKMLDSVYVRDDFQMLVTDSGFWWPIRDSDDRDSLHWKSHQYNDSFVKILKHLETITDIKSLTYRNQHPKVTNIQIFRLQHIFVTIIDVAESCFWGVLLHSLQRLCLNKSLR